MEMCSMSDSQIIELCEHLKKSQTKLIINSALLEKLNFIHENIEYSEIVPIDRITSVYKPKKYHFANMGEITIAAANGGVDKFKMRHGRN